MTEQMHAVNEFVNVKDLITATKVMAVTILDWCGYE
jgi:acetylornithine deacetylase